MTTNVDGLVELTVAARTTHPDRDEGETLIDDSGGLSSARVWDLALKALVPLCFLLGSFMIAHEIAIRDLAKAAEMVRLHEIRIAEHETTLRLISENQTRLTAISEGDHVKLGELSSDLRVMFDGRFTAADGRKLEAVVRSEMSENRRADDAWRAAMSRELAEMLAQVRVLTTQIEDSKKKE
jgi:hypothetical protein